MAIECVLGTSGQHHRITAHRNRIAKRRGRKKANMASAHFQYHLNKDSFI